MVKVVVVFAFFVIKQTAYISLLRGIVKWKTNSEIKINLTIVLVITQGARISLCVSLMKTSSAEETP